MKTTQKEAIQFGEKWFDEWIEEKQNDKGESVKFLKSLPLSFVISALDTYAQVVKEETAREIIRVAGLASFERGYVQVLELKDLKDFVKKEYLQSQKENKT